jgi:hypothetical protein
MRENRAFLLASRALSSLQDKGPKKTRTSNFTRTHFAASTPFAGELILSASGSARTALAIDKAGADS